MSPTSGEIERELLRQKREINIADMSICYHCKSTGLKDGDKFCPNCGFPQRGTQYEMQNYLRNIKLKNELLEKQRKKINKARNYLYAFAILNFLIGILFYFLPGTNKVATVIIEMIASGIYFGLALWCRKNPFAAILSGFFIYVILIVMSAVSDPSSLVKGMGAKVLFLGAFFYGYKAVKDSEKLGKELEDLKTSKDLSEFDEMPGMPAGE